MTIRQEQSQETMTLFENDLQEVIFRVLLKTQMTEDEIKDWLKTTGKKYSWLANQCHVSEGAVKNWFSMKKIPYAKILLIEKIIKEENNKNTLKENISNYDENARLIIDIPINKFRALEKIALSENTTITQSAINALEEYVNKRMDKIATKSPASTETHSNDTVEAPRYTATGLPGMSNTGQAS